MNIATWNVNGIRARQADFCAWIERDRPDVICLQELKAERAQVPPQCAHDDYHVYWHGLRAYSGVSLHVRKTLLEGREVDPRIMRPSTSRILAAAMKQA